MWWLGGAVSGMDQLRYYQALNRGSVRIERSPFAVSFIAEKVWRANGCRVALLTRDMLAAEGQREGETKTDGLFTEVW